jgi:hypothetical protein
MKKILFAIALVLTIGLTANAQERDAFFSNWDNDNYNRGADLGIGLPLGSQMSENPTNNDDPAPLGSGLVILTAIGAGYAVARRKKEK